MVQLARHRYGSLQGNNLQDMDINAVQQKNPSHLDTLLSRPLWTMHEVRLQIVIADCLNSIPPPEQLHTQPSTRLVLQTNQDPSNHKPVMRWKSWGVIVISLSAMWKVCVVSHHLSAKVCIKTALADLSGIKWMTSSKPAVRMWPQVSLVRLLYHTNTWLVLPLPKYGAKTYKNRVWLNSRLGEKNGRKVILDSQ